MSHGESYFKNRDKIVYFKAVLFKNRIKIVYFMGYFVVWYNITRIK